MISMVLVAVAITSVVFASLNLLFGLGAWAMFSILDWMEKRDHR